MNTNKIIALILIALAVVVAIFGLWLKTYNDKLAAIQYNETGSCFLSDGTCLHATSDAMLYAALGIAAFLVILGVYFLMRGMHGAVPKAKKAAEHPTEAPKTLGPETKAIYEIISQANGAILQGELVTKSGMDKVKVSRILNKLEMLGLVERRRHGMSNLVVLKKK